MARWLLVSMSFYLSDFLVVCLNCYLIVCLSVWPPVCLDGSTFVCLSVWLSRCLFTCSRIVCVSGWFFVCLVGCLVLSVCLVLFCLLKWCSSAWDIVLSVYLKGYRSVCLSHFCLCVRFFLRLFVCQSGILLVCLCPIEWLFVCLSVCLFSLSVWMILFVCLSLFD